MDGSWFVLVYTNIVHLSHHVQVVYRGVYTSHTVQLEPDPDSGFELGTQCTFSGYYFVCIELNPCSDLLPIANYTCVVSKLLINFLSKKRKHQLY